MTCITGVSGSGKSSLINNVLFNYVYNNFLDKDNSQTGCDKVSGLEYIDKIIEKAQQVRKEAQDLVNKQEKSYRYPLNLIARKIQGGGKTCYDFGYLYPVSDLHFWKREEQQIIQNKYGPFFMSLWDIPRILGIVD